MTTHSSILAWRIPWTEQPGRVQSMGLQRVEHNRGTEHPHTRINLTTINGPHVLLTPSETP